MSRPVTDLDVHAHRHAEHEIEPLLVERWSPRAMTGGAVSEEELMRLFEAARWAPSSYNGQPWRFVWARRGSEFWEAFLGLLVEFNRGWARHAGALIVVVSRTTHERNGKPARTHSFDTGAAWQNLALQGTAMELVVHAMEGFDYEAAADLLGVPDDHRVEAMVAVGRPGPVDELPEKLREQEVPSGRKPVGEIAMEGRFRA